VTIAVDTASKNDLESVKELTMQIRQRQRDIEELSHSRRSIIQRLRDSKVTYREIAEAMGTTEQNVYKILREYIAQQNAANAT
jgi:DNA invertase Pin-like site-specific DNA recombinase